MEENIFARKMKGKSDSELKSILSSELHVEDAKKAAEIELEWRQQNPRIEDVADEALSKTETKPGLFTQLEGYTFVFIYVCLTLGIHLLFRSLHLSGPMMIIKVFSVLFAVIKLYKGFLAEDKFERVVDFLIGLLLILIALKIDYNYHSKLVSFALVSTCIYLVITNYPPKLLRRSLLAMSVVTLSVIVIPDRQISSYTYRSLLTNGEPMTWNDFKGVPNQKSEHTAHVEAGLFYEINHAFDYPPAMVLSYVQPYDSWVRDRTDHASFELLLTHEQGHFYIAELCARLANDSLYTTWANEAKTKSIIGAFYDRMDSMQHLYDSLTRHGVDVELQFKWTRELKDKLGIPSLKTDLENTPYSLKPRATD